MGRLTRKLLGSLAFVALLAAVVAVSGCGGGSSAGSTDSAAAEKPTGKEPPGVQEAKKFVQAHLAPPNSIGKLEPLPKKPEAGKSVAYLECASPVCGAVGNAVKAAGEALGWTVTSTPTGASPEEITQAFDSVIQRHPDAVIQAGNPRALFEPQLKKLEAEGIPYIADASADELGGAEVAIVSDSSTYEESGRWLARWVVADTEGKANAVFFGVPDFPILVALQKGFQSEYKALCPSCPLETVNVALPSIVKGEFPSEVVSVVQRNPDLNYMVPAYGDMTLGVPQALKAAGLSDQVKTISHAGGPRNFDEIVKGLQTAEMPYPNKEAGWMLIDAAARSFAEVELPQDVYTAVLGQYLTAENIENPSEEWVAVANYEEQFKKLWKVE